MFLGKTENVGYKDFSQIKKFSGLIIKFITPLKCLENTSGLLSIINCTIRTKSHRYYLTINQFFHIFLPIKENNKLHNIIDT